MAAKPGHHGLKAFILVQTPSSQRQETVLRYTTLKKDFSAGNPIANVLVIIAGALVIGVSVVLGFFAFVALSGIVLISAAVIGLRVWWLKRKLGAKGASEMHGNGAGRASAGNIEVIEGEFHIVREERDEP